MNKFVVRFKRDGVWQSYSSHVSGMPITFANFSLADLQAQNLRELSPRLFKHAQAVELKSN